MAKIERGTDSNENINQLEISLPDLAGLLNT
jgi:hypothetical protein